MDTIIVDDEEKALDMLEFYLENYFSEYTIVGRYMDISNALEGILKYKPDVVFLDINMPSGTGIELLGKIKHLNCKVIFLTAHSEYAIDAIRQSAFDYLLKPINLDELSRVDSKIKNAIPSRVLSQTKKVKIQISNHVYLFDQDEIIFARSEGNYTTIYSTTQKPIVISKNLKKIQDEYFNELPFFRSHQSFIVNINHIVNYSSYEINLINNHIAYLSSKNYELLSAHI